MITVKVDGPEVDGAGGKIWRVKTSKPITAARVRELIEKRKFFNYPPDKYSGWLTFDQVETVTRMHDDRKSDVWYWHCWNCNGRGDE